MPGKYLSMPYRSQVLTRCARGVRHTGIQCVSSGVPCLVFVFGQRQCIAPLQTHSVTKLKHACSRTSRGGTKQQKRQRVACSNSANEWKCSVAIGCTVYFSRPVRMHSLPHETHEISAYLTHRAHGGRTCDQYAILCYFTGIPSYFCVRI